MKIWFMKNVLLFIPFLCILNIADAQEKKAMDHSVYEIWNEIKSPMIPTMGNLFIMRLIHNKGMEDWSSTI